MPDGTQQRAKEQGAAFAVVLIINWLIAHLATNWVLPPEVAQAFQTVISFMFGGYLDARQRMKDAKAAEARRVLEAPDPRDPKPQPA